MLKTITMPVLLITCMTSITASYAFTTVNMYNATSCLVTTLKDGTNQTSKVSSVDVYSFFYKSDDPNSYTYYSTVPANSMGQVAVGDYLPSVTDGPNIILDYSSSTTKSGRGVTGVGQPGNFNNNYIYQYMDLTNTFSPCSQAYCLTFDVINPCGSL